MRKIEKQMLQAIETKAFWKEGNTMVHGMSGDVYLHQNHIATVENDVLTVNKYTLCKWPSNTTKSRLRALGANVTTIKGLTYLDGVPV